VPTPFSEVHDVRSKPTRVQADTQCAGGRPEQLRINVFKQQPERTIRDDNIPVPVDNQRRIRLVRLQENFEGDLA